MFDNKKIQLNHIKSSKSLDTEQKEFFFYYI